VLSLPWQLNDRSALHDVPLYREFSKLDGATARLPDKTHNLAVDMLRVVNDLLRGLMLRSGTAVGSPTGSSLCMLQTHSAPRLHQLPPRQPQVPKREQRDDPRRGLRQPSIAHLRQPEPPL
jgi:hypothetical protein